MREENCAGNSLPLALIPSTLHIPDTTPGLSSSQAILPIYIETLTANLVSNQFPKIIYISFE